jgi:putative aldouronate transport system substrate-binding protein
MGSFPIVDPSKKAQITIMLSYFSNDFNPDTNWMTKYYEDKTGVHVNWILVPSEQFKERSNLALASGEKIDFIFTGLLTGIGYTQIEQQKLAAQGIIQPLDDLLKNHTSYMNKVIDQYEMFRQVLTQPNGHIYTLPTLSECYHCMYYGKLWVNKEFLKNVGITKYPTTVDEFHDMLVAFRDKDANGNGDPTDEIPFSGATQQGVYSSKVDTYIMSSFIYDDGENRLFVDNNGKIVAAFQQPEFQEGLKLLRQWYSEGLIYPDTFTQNLDARAKLNSTKYESIIGVIPYEHMYNSGNREEGEPQRWIDYESIPPLKGPKGVQTTRYSYYNKFSPDLPGGIIPITAVNPELAMRWLDWFYSEEGTVMLLLGEKGRAWTDADPGATGPDGSPAQIKMIEMKPTDAYYSNYSFNNIFPNIQSSEYRNKQQSNADMLAIDGSGAERYLYMKSRDNYAPYAPQPKNLIPPLFYSEADASSMARMQSDINTYVDECIAAFVVGRMNIDTQWQSFQNELKNLGIDRYLEIIQRTYNSSSFSKR